MPKTIFVGIDVAKSKLDTTILFMNDKTRYKQFKNASTGFAQLLAWLKQQDVADTCRVCMEATGPYSESVAQYLSSHGIEVCIENPLKIKYFAKSLLARNKNDHIDSLLIARYAKVAKMHPFKVRSKEQKEVRELAQLVESLKKQLTQLTNQRDTCQSTIAKRELDKFIKALEAKIKVLQAKIKKQIQEDNKLSRIMELLLSIKGVGELTAIYLIAHLPDISQFRKAKELAAYAGLSPKQCESGAFIGKTHLSRFGSSRMRRALYMPALVIKNKNQHFAGFVSRLESNGLAPKAIVGAVMRKLIHVIFGMIKNNQPFDPALV